MLTPLLGAAAAGIFLASLIASGISSSVVGTMAGQMIMQGFLRFRVPIWLRRLVTMLPAFVVVAMGVNVTMVSVGLMLGPALGGLISGTVGWRYVFLLPVPVMFMASIAVIHSSPNPL